MKNLQSNDPALIRAIARMNECRAACGDVGEPFYADPHAWDYICAALNQMADFGEITNEQIEAACRAFLGLSAEHKTHPQDTIRKYMRAALEAAARVRGGDARQMIAWQSMETAPKDGTRILLGCAKHHSVICGFWDANLGGWRSPCGEEADHLCASDPTAWTYLPEPTQ